jgi:DNA-directed RNA polymerase subunit L
MSTYMSYYENVFYCGYVIEHPLNNNIIFKIKLKENNTLENAIILIEQCFTMLIDILEKIIAELKKYK